MKRLTRITPQSLKRVGTLALGTWVLSTVGCMDLDEVRIAIVRVLDDDGYLDPGQNAALEISLRNREDTELEAVRLQLSSPSPWAEVIDDYGVNCGNILGGATVACPIIRIAVAADAPEDRAIPFIADCRDFERYSISLGFDLSVRDLAPKPWVAKAEIRDDANSDGQLSPGETATLHLELGNSGKTVLAGATVSLRNLSSFVDLPDNTAHYCGNISPGLSAKCSPSWGIGVDHTVETPVNAELILDVSSSFGTTWALPLTLSIDTIAAELQVVGFDVIADGNVDGVLNPNEPAWLGLRLYNAGNLPSEHIELSLSPLTAGVLTVAEEAISCGSLAAGEQGSCEAVAVLVGASAPPSGVVAMQAALSDAAGSEWTESVDLPILPTAGLPILADLDGTLIAGATVPLTVRLRNVGTSQLVATELNLVSATAGVIVMGSSTVNCGNIAPSSAANCDAISVKTLGAIDPANATLSATVTDSTGAQWSISVLAP